jgi:hypothetical protein
MSELDNTYAFTAIRGIQAGREYYVAMCPMKMIPRLFVFDDQELPAELRAQRGPRANAALRCRSGRSVF